MSEQDFAHALELYRVNYLQYRTTGRSEYKIAYENAERWIQTYLENISNQIASGRSFVNTFLQNYSTASPDMDTLKRKFTAIRKEGPIAEDQYITVKKINEASDSAPDASPYYVKGGILLSLIAAVFMLSVF